MFTVRFFDRLIEYSFYALFFLVPLVLTPWNYELFEFNKMILTYGLTVIIVGAWVAKWITAKTIKIQKTPFDIPILLFLASQILSTIFSLDRHTSLWGYYSRFHGGLLSTISYIVLYYAFVSNMIKAQSSKLKAQSQNTNQPTISFKLSALSYQLRIINCLYFLLASAGLITLYGIAEHFGIDARYWVQDVRNRVFSTLGQPNWLGAWIDGIILIPLAFILKEGLNSSDINQLPSHNSKFKIQNAKSQFKIQKYILYSIFYILYSCLLFTGSRSAYIGFLTTLTVFIFLFVILKLLSPGILRAKPEGSPRGFFATLRMTEGLRMTGWTRMTKFLMFFLSSIIFISLLAGTPFSPSLFKSLTPPPSAPPAQTQPQRKEPILISTSQEIRRVVWTGAIDVWQHWPVFGSGVETFAYSYYNFRPREHNDLSEWDFLYNKAHNEYLNYLATTGIVGLGTYLLMIGWILVWGLKKIKNQKSKRGIPSECKNIIQNLKLIENNNYPNYYLLITIYSGYVSILVTNFFGFSVVPVALLFWLFPAFMLGLMGNDKPALVYDFNPPAPDLSHIRKKEKFFAKHQQFSNLTRKQWNNEAMKQLNNLQKFLLIILFLFILYTLYSILMRLWWSDVKYTQGKKLTESGYLLQGQKELAAAVSLNPAEPLFLSQLSENTAMISLAYYQKEASAAATMVGQLSSLAEKQAQESLRLNPYHLNYYKTAVKTYLYLAQVNPVYYQQAIALLKKAGELAPTDPKLTYNLALIYQQLGEKEPTLQYLEQTVDLKPNYLTARLALAKLYRQLGEKNEALAQLHYIIDNLDSANEETLSLLKEWQEK